MGSGSGLYSRALAPNHFTPGSKANWGTDFYCRLSAGIVAVTGSRGSGSTRTGLILNAPLTLGGAIVEATSVNGDILVASSTIAVFGAAWLANNRGEKEMTNKISKFIMKIPAATISRPGSLRFSPSKT